MTGLSRSPGTVRTPLWRVKLVNTEHILDAVRSILAGDQRRADTASRVAAIIRQAGPYRWVGLYDVDRSEISTIAWSGEQAPTYPRFPMTRGLGGAVVSTGQSIVVGDVTKDPRYLTTFGSTRSELVVPVRDLEGTIIGLIDVESEMVNAFSEHDRQALEHCARILTPLFVQTGEKLPPGE